MGGEVDRGAKRGEGGTGRGGEEGTERGEDRRGEGDGLAVGDGLEG